MKILKSISVFILLLFASVSVFSQNSIDDIREKSAEYIRATEYDLAIKYLEENIDVIQNDTTGVFEILTDLYGFRNEWQKIVDVYKNRTLFAYDEDTTAGFYSTLANYPAQKIEFSSPQNIPFKTNKYNATLVDVVINGEKYTFWFDTGASWTVLSSKVAKRCNVTYDLSVSEKEITSSTIINAYPGNIDLLEVGGVKIHNHKCEVIDKRNLQFRILGIPLVKIDGIIGWNFFQEFDVTLNDITQTVTLADINTSETGNNFFWSHQPTISCKDSSNMDLLFLYDTGAAYSLLYDTYLEKADTTKAIVTTKDIYGVGGKVEMKVYKFDVIKLYVDNQEFVCKNMHTISSFGGFEKSLFPHDGIFGKREVKGKIVHFNIEQGYFDITE